MKFDQYHPMINLLFFMAVLAGTVLFNHPVFLVISFVCPFLYSIKLKGMGALWFNIALLPGIAAFSAFYASFNHFGVTNLGENAIGNKITLESIVYGGALGATAAALLLWFSCIHMIFSADKIVYLLGRIAPKLSLFCAVLLRAVPHIRQQAKKIHLAQKGIGRGVTNGNIFRRTSNFLRLISMVAVWTGEHFITAADSMKSRGCTLKGRTAFSIYRFDRRDRAFVIGIFSAVTVLLMGVLFQQTRISYNPEILLNRITPLSVVFYGAYLFLCLLPCSLQILGEQKMQRLYHFKISSTGQ
ncbi:MAG: energy-coupling factor transporter transmembrane component T [Oscillospiraceae bacterium]